MSSNITAEADTLLKEHLVQDPPVPILEILESEGYIVHLTDFSEYTGEVAGYIDLQAKTVFLNQADSPARQAVTMGYALGLLKLHQPKLEKDPDLRVCYRLPITEQVTDAVKADGHEFAACLLIPKSSLEKYAENQLASSSSLAIVFGVTQELLSYRLQTLDSHMKP